MATFRQFSNKRMKWEMRSAGVLVPAYVGEVALTSNYQVQSGTSQVITLNQAVSVGHRVAIGIAVVGNMTMTAVDSKENAWTQIVQSSDTFWSTVILSAHLTTALASSDTVTITISGDTGFTGRNWVMIDLTDCATSGQPDQSAANSTYAAAVSLAASTIAANTVLFGLLFCDNSALSYTGGNWTTIGALRTNAQNAKIMAFVTKTEATADSKNPGGTWGTANGQINTWAAFK
jgi:hypothetical protein